MKLRNVPTSAALAAALVFSSQQVYAAEGKLLLDQLVALAGVEGTKITWGAINEQDSRSFTLSDVQIVDKDGEKIILKATNPGETTSDAPDSTVNLWEPRIKNPGW